MSSIDPFPSTIEEQKELIERVLAGCTESFAKIATHFGPRIDRYIRPRIRNSADAEDLTQEILLAVYKGLRNFDGRAQLWTWICSIANNKLTEFRRFWSAEKRDEDRTISFEALRSNDGEQNNAFDPSDANFEQPLDRLLRNEHETIVRQAILSLSNQDFQNALLLRIFESKTYEKIATEMNASIENVKTWLNRGRAELKEKLT